RALDRGAWPAGCGRDRRCAHPDAATANRPQHDRRYPGAVLPLLDLDVRPLSGRIGAEIAGVDLTQTLEREAVAGIRAALLRWKVVFFRDQHLTQDQHRALARSFGSVTPAHPTLPAAC